MLDSANLTEIRCVKELGLLEGLTTNPLIFKRGWREENYEGSFLDYAKRILELTAESPTFFQVIGRSKEEIQQHAHNLYDNLKQYGNVYIKVPIDVRTEENEPFYEGFQAIRELCKEKVPILATAIVTPTQAFLAAKAGADYAALMLRPYDESIASNLDVTLDQTGYLDNEYVQKIVLTKGKEIRTYLSGFDILHRTAEILKTQKLETKLLIAGIRNPIQASQVLATEGVSAITLPYTVFTSLFPHERTKKFVVDTYDATPPSYRAFLNHGKR